MSNQSCLDTITVVEDTLMEFQWSVPVSQMRARYIITRILREFVERDVLISQSELHRTIGAAAEGETASHDILVDEIAMRYAHERRPRNRIHDNLGFTFADDECLFVTHWRGLIYADPTAQSSLDEMTRIMRDLRTRPIPSGFVKDDAKNFALPL